MSTDTTTAPELILADDQDTRFRFRALLNAWWDDNFTTDYIIDRTGNYKSQADCIEDLVIRASAALTEPKKQEERPDRLREGDVWEFWADVCLKGKRKPVEKLLQWRVVGWHSGQHAWELRSLDGEHETYLMEFAPRYEDMRYIGTAAGEHQ